MGLPKEGSNPSQYFWGKDNDKKLVVKLKKIYNLKCNGHAYIVENINEQVVRIAAKILASKLV